MNPKAAALLLLPTLACAVGPNYTKPEIPVPKAWNEGRAMKATAERRVSRNAGGPSSRTPPSTAW